ncbi:MAG: hypothetical protein K8T20_10510 [Planctomycetes bacterium]|nr:hypothetical protein [Planctomycetota bacterium]
MKTLFRLAALAFAVTLFAGCLESDQQTVLYGDGSGKIVWSLSVKLKGDEKEEPMKPEKLAEMENSADGIVAWAEPKIVKENGSYRVTLVAYFDDISKVKLYEDKGGEKKEMLSFEFAKNGDGGTLTVKDSLTADAAKKAEEKKDPPKTDEEKQMAEGMKKMMAEMVAGLRLAISVKAPGTVTAEKFSKVEGRVASLVIDDKLILDSMDEKPEAQKALEGMAGDRKVTWTKNEVPTDEMEAFKKELAAAKAAWAKKKEQQGK